VLLTEIRWKNNWNWTSTAEDTSVMCVSFTRKLWFQVSVSL